MKQLENLKDKLFLSLPLRPNRRQSFFLPKRPGLPANAPASIECVAIKGLKYLLLSNFNAQIVNCQNIISKIIGPYREREKERRFL